MKPLINTYEPQGDLFEVELTRIVDTRHGLVRLAATVDWSRMEDLFGETYCADNGRPGIPTRLMVALHYLKYTFNLSDEGDCLNAILSAAGMNFRKLLKHAATFWRKLFLRPKRCFFLSFVSLPAMS